MHNSHFTVYAVDVPTLGLTGDFGAAEALAAMERHVLAQSSWSGSYATAYNLVRMAKLMAIQQGDIPSTQVA